MAQCATRSIAHHQKRCAILHIKFHNLHNVGVQQVSYRTCFGAKLLDFVEIDESCMQDFNGRLNAQMEVFPQIDFGKATTSKLTNQSIVANLLAEKVLLSHTGILP